MPLFRRAPKPSETEEGRLLFEEISDYMKSVLRNNADKIHLKIYINEDIVRRVLDVDASVEFTKNLRRFLCTDAIIAPVFKEGSFMHLHQLAIGTAQGMSHTQRAGGKVGIVVMCPKAAELLSSIMARQDLKELNDGVRLLLYHELGHAKAQGQEAFSMLRLDGSEALAQSYALSKIEKGKRENGIKAMGVIAAISMYLMPYKDLGWHAREVLFAHWEDRLGVSTLGLTKFNYLGDQKVKDDVAAAAKQYFDMLEREFGKADYGNAALAKRMSKLGLSILE